MTETPASGNRARRHFTTATDLPEGSERGMNLPMTADATRLLAEYSADHQNPFNRLVHSICVPLIFVSIIALLWAIPLPATVSAAAPWLNLGTLVLAGTTIYYLRLAPRLGLGMLVAALLIVPLLTAAAGLAMPLWQQALAVFVVAWIGQFIGHYVEGKRPSFFRDLRFLLIGPLWVLEKLYATLGIRA
jgi:uncharacterized membrane protein YGL010W